MSVYPFRTLKEFQISQFGDRKQRIYDAAKLKLDLGTLSEPEAVNAFLTSYRKRVEEQAARPTMSASQPNLPRPNRRSS